jgi:acyl-CoA thioesterase FadM
VEVKTDETGLDVGEFTWKLGVIGPQHGEHGVVRGVDLTVLLHDAVNDLISELFGVTDPQQLSNLTVRPILRSLTASFDAPLIPGSPILIGATLGSLGQRSFELRAAIWLAENRRQVAHGSVTYVVFDTAAQTAAPVPERVVQALNSLRPAPEGTP